MRNRESWKPTKIVKANGKFQPSRDPKMVGVASRLIVLLACQSYYGAIREHAKGRLLDLGCGDVPYYEMYSKFVDDVVCIDWPRSLHRNAHVDILADLNQPIPLRDESIDTILLADVLEHIAEPQILLKEAGRVLKREGKVIIGVPFLYWLHETPHDYYRYTEFALRRLCEQSSLNVISVEAYGGAPEVLMDIFGKVLTLSSTLGSLLPAYSRLATFLATLRPVRKISRATASALPIGYCLVAKKCS